MSSLADKIEEYIKEILNKSQQRTVQLKRNQLAEKFMCVPSQINYVLSTRFGVEQGYLVESRRGGGGYVRITKLPLSNEEQLLGLIDDTPELVSQQIAEGLLNRLYEEDFLTVRETLLLKTIIQRETLCIELPERDVLRANILRAMLRTILRYEFSE